MRVERSPLAEDRLSWNAAVLEHAGELVRLDPAIPVSSAASDDERALARDEDVTCGSHTTSKRRAPWTAPEHANDAGHGQRER